MDLPENANSLSGLWAIWSAILTAGLSVMGYLVQKRDEKIDQAVDGIRKLADANAALELKVSENYATKATVMALFQEAVTQNKDAIARVEKNIDEAKSAINKQGDKIDKVLESVNNFQTNVMQELAKKT